jgi:hypothetical protein
VIYLILKFILIFSLLILLKFVEMGFSSFHRERGFFQNIPLLYDILYLHLPMSMASLSLIFDKLITKPSSTYSPLMMFLVFILTLLGSISRGFLSNNTTETLSYFDRDFSLGVYIPNALGTASLLIALYI